MRPEHLLGVSVLTVLLSLFCRTGQAGVDESLACANAKGQATSGGRAVTRELCVAVLCLVLCIYMNTRSTPTVCMSEHDVVPQVYISG